MSLDKKMSRPAVPVWEDAEATSEPDFVVGPREPSVSPQEILNLVRRNYLVILAVGAGAVAWRVHQQQQTVPMYVSGGTIRFTDMRSNLTSGVGSAVSSQAMWVVDPIKSELELLSSGATAEEAVTIGNLQLREVSPIGSVNWPNR